MQFDIDQIRSQFPILEQKVYGQNLVYLDSGATSQKPICVIEKEKQIYSCYNANVHRGVHYLADYMTAEYEGAREIIQKYIGARYREEVIFTAGATASINCVAYSYCGQNLKKGDNIVVSYIEHHSNIVPWQLACERCGACLRVIPVAEDGALILDNINTLIDERTKVVAITQASNTLGTCPDLKPIIARAHDCGAVVLVDGCQGIVHSGVDVAELNCDFYAFSGHKLYGPNGIGVLYIKKQIGEAMQPFMGGGDMIDRVTFEKTTFAPLPLRFEAGTPNYVGAVALGEAIKFLQNYNKEDIFTHENRLLKYATEKMKSIAGLKIYGTTENKAPIICFNIDGCDHYDVGMIIDKMGVAIRTGHHCAEPTMKYFGVNGMCRVSFGLYNTFQEVDMLIEALNRAIKMLR